MTGSDKTHNHNWQQYASVRSCWVHIPRDFVSAGPPVAGAGATDGEAAGVLWPFPPIGPAPLPRRPAHHETRDQSPSDSKAHTEVSTESHSAASKAR